MRIATLLALDGKSCCYAASYLIAVGHVHCLIANLKPYGGDYLGDVPGADPWLGLYPGKGYLMYPASDRKRSRSLNALYTALALAPGALIGGRAHGAPQIINVANQYHSNYGYTGATVSCTVSWDTGTTGNSSIVDCYFCSYGTSGPWVQFPQWTYGGLGWMNVELDGVDDSGGCDNITLSDDGGMSYGNKAGV